MPEIPGDQWSTSVSQRTASESDAQPHHSNPDPEQDDRLERVLEGGRQADSVCS